MATDEFSLISTYFSSCGVFEADTLLGVGDDCALVMPPAGEVLAVTTDTLLEGVHFPADSPPELIAQRALCVNLSDMAAMGAKPRWFQLALTIPNADPPWLAAFSAGLNEIACRWGCALVGGDTTRGPLTITITLMGSIPANTALKRSGAKAGDGVYVSGFLGDGAAGLATVLGELSVDEESAAYLQARFWQPEPRVSVGQRIRNFASSAIDISDGLLADLGHITECSGVGACVDVDQIPLSPALRHATSFEKARRWAMTGGDDYELCFTVPLQNQALCQQAIDAGLLEATLIGTIVDGSGVCCIDGDGTPLDYSETGYKHF